MFSIKVSLFLITLLLFNMCTLKKDFKVLTHYSSGQVHKIGDTCNGEFNAYFPNGQLYSKGFYKNNKMNGNWIAYDEEGRKIFYSEYSDGKLNGLYIMYDSSGFEYLKVRFKEGSLEEVIIEPPAN